MKIKRQNTHGSVSWLMTLNDPANGTNAELLIELSAKKEEAEERLLELYEHLEEIS